MLFISQLINLGDQSSASNTIADTLVISNSANFRRTDRARSQCESYHTYDPLYWDIAISNFTHGHVMTCIECVSFVVIISNRKGVYVFFSFGWYNGHQGSLINHTIVFTTVVTGLGNFEGPAISSCDTCTVPMRWIGMKVCSAINSSIGSALDLNCVRS